MLGSSFIRNSLHYLMAKSSCPRWASTIAAANQLQAKNLQETALAENCILVDEFDRAIGQSSKRDCHRVDENGHIKLHRAFSVFLFNTNGDMLIQKRSSHKITFPDCYTNACCSHPLYDIECERDEINAMGIRKAAQRRLNYELGIPLNQARPENFHYLTRIHYEDSGDGTWGEHEIDYILFLQKNVDLIPNPNEVSEVFYVPRNDLESEIQRITSNAPLTPWFRLILTNKLLTNWWDNLSQLKKLQDHQTIQRL
ncbi:isopentenyl-diphosphate Delta-isomerase 1 [Sitodiplosis mosellana]|uniref:isopentenyl-diphosphate Delta-isomerase 1 n=1 Tax=Sitodiplosis mosellana TaxID=263140 RepID=UPI002444CD5C|nr:isopentenyl-diphosphate Delta-isomerase 1 [Sitodiplosis mosellana]